jgi:hypothetical protein
MQFQSFFTAGRQNSPLERTYISTYIYIQIFCSATKLPLECIDSRLLLLPCYKTFHLNEQVQSFFQYYIYFLSTTKTKTSPKEKSQAEAAAASRAP